MPNDATDMSVIDIGVRCSSLDSVREMNER